MSRYSTISRLDIYSIASPRNKALIQVFSRGIKNNAQAFGERHRRQFTEEHKAKLKAAWTAKSQEERQLTEEQKAKLKAVWAAKSQEERRRQFTEEHIANPKATMVAGSGTEVEAVSATFWGAIFPIPGVA